MRQLSDTLKEEIFARESGAVEITLLTIEQAELEEPIRCATDGPMVLSSGHRGVVSNGQEYVHFPFEPILPGESADQFPTARLKIDNVSREILLAVRRMSGPADITFSVCLASNPDLIEISVSGLRLRNVTADAMTVEGELTPEQFEYEAFPVGRFTPAHFPGLFPGAE